MLINDRSNIDTSRCRPSREQCRVEAGEAVRKASDNRVDKVDLSPRRNVETGSKSSAAATQNSIRREGNKANSVFVINKNGNPLMPCSPRKARKLLEANKAKVIKRMPFTIKLLWDCEENLQEIIAGMDTGSKTIGCAAVTNGHVVYQSEVQLRQDVSKKLKQRAMYRRNRRGRKCRYRPARWLNRGKKGSIAPSLRSKIESHLREKTQVESILPITRWKVETASFDIHKITNPDVKGKKYQDGNQKGYYNIKSYILHRDGYKCCSGQKVKHSDKLHVHHIRFRSNDGTDSPENLITLCEICHKNLHKDVFELKVKKTRTKHATEVGIVKSQLKKLWDFEETFGYETKFKREQVLNLPKTHANDAVAICCEDGELAKSLDIVHLKRHVSSGDYQQRKGSRSEVVIPTGKLFGLRKFDLIKTSKGIGFVKGKRSSGHFAIMDLEGNTISSSVNVKKDCIRISARKTTLNQLKKERFLPRLKPEVSSLNLS